MKQSATKSGSASAESRTPFFHKGRQGSFFNDNSRSSFFKGAPVQAKLSIGEPGDHYEREADHMADRVVQRTSEPSVLQAMPQAPLMPITSIAGASPVIEKCAACERKEQLQEKEEEQGGKPEKLQKKSIFQSNEEPSEEGHPVQRKCAACEREAGLVQKKSPDSPQGVPSDLENNLRSSKGSGSPMPEQTRGQMESSFGADLGKVRVHDNPSAARMNKDLHSHAFTHGSDIYFNSGKYDVNSKGGKHLLAHELTHVVQQRGGAIQRACDPTITTCIPESYNSCNPTIASCPPPEYSEGQSEQAPSELIPSQEAGNFALIPIINPPPDMLADIPEGQMVSYVATDVPSELNGVLPSLGAKEFVAPGSAGFMGAVNSSLMTTGFAGIEGGNGIGMIAIPRLFSAANAALPETMSIWGHTAVYVRINGQITLARGYTIESFMATATDPFGISSGVRSTPGVIANDLDLFTVTNARTVEWPVSAEVAKNFADSLPEAGAAPPGGPSLYTGRPGVNAEGAANCVGWACNAVEEPIGGQPGTSNLGNIAEPAEVTQGLQGRMMQLTKSASEEVSPGGAVVSGMSRTLVVLKWGGRLFLVAGAAITVYQVLNASGEHKREEQGRAVGAFGGGVLTGAFIGGVCIGLGIFTGGLALLACGVIGAAAGVGGAFGGAAIGGGIGKQFD